MYSVNSFRDKLGRILQNDEIIEGVVSTFEYDYNQRGFLTQVMKDGQLVASYDYDNNGNRVQLQDNNGVITVDYDDQDRLTRYGSTNYQYNARGELVHRDANGAVTEFLYDAFRNLRAITLPTGSVVEYLVDGFHRRLGKKINGVLMKGWIYGDRLTPIAEVDANGNLLARFVYGTSGYVPDFMIRSGQTFRLITDQLGSVRLVVDVTTGFVAQRLDYDAFGVVLADSNPGFQPFGFAGGLYDSDTGLVRFGYRDYDPVIGRWLLPEPIRFSNGETNLYLYSRNDPVNYFDPDGLRWRDPKNKEAYERAAREARESGLFPEPENKGTTNLEPPPEELKPSPPPSPKEPECGLSCSPCPTK